MRDSETEQTTTAEFDAALAHAERLLGTVRDLRRAISRLRLAEIAAAAAWVLACALVRTGSASSRTDALLVVAVITYAGLALAVETLGVRPLVPRIRRDERSMIELVDTLRELSPHLARREGWSGMRQNLVRTRLGQFPIGVPRESR
ncbi:hypothetical protein [Actinoplanes subtropicus]|uniref:hypothetical protein n=1 Tax=Actinoplanes subtropicus TaxID=543632 RepID=UPI0004C44D6B|nr:hypothetical protein [Actinoplanes subtropicus]